MTVEEIVLAALARGMEFTNELPQTRSVHYRRITMRQQQLFVRAAEINPDYFGKSVSVNVVAGVADLSGLDPQAERVSGVRINGAGTSGYAAGRRVSIVPLDDSGYAGLPPRANIRDYTLTQVSTDLALVASVWIDYSKRPADLTAAEDEPELPAQFHELLVIDDTKAMVRKLVQTDTAQRTAFLQVLNDEEAELVVDFERHVERFALGEESRFGRTARPWSAPKTEA